MSRPSTIGGLARATAVPVSTLRYWERVGLLRPDGRTGANYRWFGPGAIDRVRFIRTAQSMGFTLLDVRDLLHLRDGRTARCRDVRVLMEQRRADVERRIAELRDFRGAIDSLLRRCRAGRPAAPCPALKTLGSTALPPT